ncbi:unnamed protein product [Rangifer tarandus platyrhynchus]|uniref:Uncharacterized protein n=2 Tax=Rangifer tarandus platyrhynchus TaxID=3082113 RepID=A0ACB0EHR3_RANTA|nr:unnamed protein product [Rangifer tarandus platyrhynchus]CAI9699909.1 unnamed protein product [Rangifer tarandus platyrhynchus]
MPAAASVSLRLRTHKASVTDPPASGTRAAVVVHLDLLGELQHKPQLQRHQCVCTQGPPHRLQSQGHQ